MKLTDHEFWLNYWESKSDLIFPVPENFILSNFLKDICSSNKINASLELGGFPGHYSVYLRKYLGVIPTLLDYVIHPKILKDLAKINGLEENDIDIVEADLFNKKNNRKFDLVFSNGLIEHFENTQEIIDIHASYLNDGGTLYISLPNFRGLNGWLQKNFDKENYEKHYIECMNTALLKNVSENIGLKNVKVFYFGKFMIWLENIQQKSGVFQVGFKTLWLCFKVIFKLIPIETKWFSPYIVIIATK